MMYRKYGNKKAVVDGITFDSKREANRYLELKMLERAGKISELELQKKFVLIPTQYENPHSITKKGRGKCIERECAYYADFYYYDLGKHEIVVEDSKGLRTEVYKIKKKLMLERFGIRIREV